MSLGDGDFPREGCEYALKVRVLSSSQGPVRVGVRHRFGSGSVRPPAADDARRDLEFQRLSWLGCLRHGQRNLVMVGLRIRGGVWAGFVSGQGERATFCPSGETHTSFCPGIHVSGMFVSIVVIFCPGGAGIRLGTGGGASGCGVV